MHICLISLPFFFQQYLQKYFNNMPLHFLGQCKHPSNLNKMQLFVLLLRSVFPGSVKLLIFWGVFSTKILGVDLAPPHHYTKTKLHACTIGGFFCFCIILTRDINTGNRDQQLVLIYVSVLTLYSLDIKFVSRYMQNENYAIKL